jgi:lysophospholipase L1-like esterase
VATATVTVSSSNSGGSTSATGMQLISRGVPAYASSGQYPASYADDSDYNTVWRSVGVPSTLTYDLSSVPAADRQTILLVWYNDETYGYDHAIVGADGYNNPGSYTVQVNAAAGGGAAPTTGWVTVATVSGNTMISLEHLLNFAGYNWVQLNFTVSDGSAENDDIAINMDVYNAAPGVTDGWFFGGDSITANCMGHANANTVASAAFGLQVDALNGHIPLQINGGIPGWDTTNWIPYMPTWLENFQGKYVTINLGTNDAAGSLAPATFYSNLLTLVGSVEADGFVAVVPTIPYSLDPTHMANIPGLNAQIESLYINHPTVVPGPDLYTYFENNPSLISSDNVHPTDQGCADYRAQWAQFAARQYAQTSSAPPTVSLSSSPPTIAPNASSTLTWSATNATSCAASGSWTGTQATSGNLVVSPSSSSYYTLACTGPGGSGFATTSVTVN